MYIIITAQELSDAGSWIDFCEDHGIDSDRFSECGDWNESFTITGQEFLKYGLSLSAHK